MTAAVQPPQLRTEPTGRGIRWFDVAVLAALTLLPQLLTGRGRLNADTKQYLYLDPVDLLDRARVVWDSRVGGGTVTHQAVGYLWPMGPFYAATDAVGIPDWAAQRLWVGGLQLVAGLGALALFRHLLRPSRVHVAAAALYALSPFVLGLGTSQSGLLVPYAGLGWLVLLMARAVEAASSWRWPAAFALVVTTCGSLNGSSVFFVVLAAVLWVPFALAGTGRAGLRTGLGVLLRTGALTLATQLWWIVAYAVGGGYGLPVLDVTETVGVTNFTSSAVEVLRGLGYWTFYGVDSGGLWLRGLADPYQTSLPLLAVTLAIPVAALTVAAFMRWRHRAYFATLAGVGVVLSVGAFPIADPSPAGDAFEALSRRVDLVLSLRNTQRAAALVALSVAAFAAAGLSALEARWSAPPADVAAARARRGLGPRDTLWRRTLGLSPAQRAGVHAWLARWAPPAAAAGIVALAVAALPAQWRAGLIAERFHREDIPEAWQAAADHLDRREGRVLEIPGIDFAAHRWGHALDPITVGLTDRPVIGRELVPTGGAPGADLVEALDRSMQEGWFEPAALAPVARLLGATDVLVRNDLEYERHRTVRPRVLWPALTSEDNGLGAPETFGGPYDNRASAELPMIDPVELALDPDAPRPPQLAAFPVPDGGRAPLSARSPRGAVVVDGDGEGVVAAAAAGLLDPHDGPLLLGADLARAGGALDDRTDDTTRWILTDSNRKRAKRWATLYENAGATQPVDGAAALDETDARLELVEDAPPGSHTVVRWRGAERIWATAYGAPATFLPEDRPSNAFDGDPRTAWRSEREPDGATRSIGIDLGRPVTADHLTLVPTDRHGSVAVTRARVTLDGARRFDVELTEEQARDTAGARVELDGEPFTTVTVRVLDTIPDIGRGGFAEVQIPGVEVEEVVSLPTALVDQVGDRLAGAPAAIVLSRLRADPADPLRDDPELSMHRLLHVPVALDATVTGTARLAPDAPEPVLDRLLGAGPERWPVRATSSARLPGDIGSRASAALDQDPRTAWQTPLHDVRGQWLQADLLAPVTLATLRLTVQADEHHSIPTALEVQVDGGAPQTVALPPVETGSLGATAELELPLPQPLTGRRWRLTIAEVDERRTTDWYTGFDTALPVGIAEVALPGVPARPEAAVDTGCRDDLLTIDGRRVAVRVLGPVGDAAARRGLEVAPCAFVEQLPAGDVELRTASGLDTGLHLDRLVLRTPAWGEEPAGARGPDVTLDEEHPDQVAGRVRTDGAPFWLVLDQSMNDGWELTVDGATVDGPRPIDAFAAGWYVEPRRAGTLDVRVAFAPQRAVDLALIASGLAAALCVVLLVASRGARGARTERAGRRPRPGDPWIGRSPWPPGGPARAGEAVSWSTVVAAALAAAVLVEPVAAVPAALVGIAARRWPIVSRVAPAALVAMAAALVVVEQVRRDHPAKFAWPAEFVGAHRAAMLGAVLLLVFGVAARRRPGRRRDDRAPVDAPVGSPP